MNQFETPKFLLYSHGDCNFRIRHFLGFTMILSKGLFFSQWFFLSAVIAVVGFVCNHRQGIFSVGVGIFQEGVNKCFKLNKIERITYMLNNIPFFNQSFLFSISDSSQKMSHVRIFRNFWLFSCLSHFSFNTFEQYLNWRKCQVRETSTSLK